MLDIKTKKEIVNFVHAKPRTIQEVALHIKKNWRTADRYIDKISKETGEIETRTFREGTRGALKLVYYVNLDQISGSLFQEMLLKRIDSGRTKDDFSPFDIYQFVDPDLRRAKCEFVESDFAKGEKEFIELFRSAQEKIMIFSGNLSWANANTKMIEMIVGVCKAGVDVKIVSRVDVATMQNLKKVMDVNNQIGREAIEVRHVEQPLRCILIDNKIATLKEQKVPEKYRQGELRKKLFLFYEIKDIVWLEWLERVFWHLFRSGIPAEKRLESLNSIKNLEPA